MQKFKECVATTDILINVIYWRMQTVKSLLLISIKMKKKFKTIDDLVLGIESIVSQNRGSLSNDDVVLLNKCCVTLKEFKKEEKPVSFISNEIFANLISIMLKVFSNIDFNDFL